MHCFLSVISTSWGLRLSANGEDRTRYIAAPLYGTDKNRYSARIADNVETFAHMADHCLIYDNGVWYMLNKGECTRLESCNFIPAHKDMRMFSVYVEGGYGLEKINVPNSWSQLQEYANQVKWTLYVFRKERLVKIIRPYNLKS